MKILQVVHGFPPIDKAGAETYTFNLSKSLTKKHEIFVFARVLDRSKPEYHVHDEDIDGIRVRRMVNNFTGIRRFEQFFLNEKIDAVFLDYLKQVKPDIVHLQHLIGLSSNIINIIKERGIPVVMHLHDYWYFCPRVQLIDKSQDVCEGPREGYMCTVKCCAHNWPILPLEIEGTPVWRLLKRITPQPVQRFIKYQVLGTPKKQQKNVKAADTPIDNSHVHEELFQYQLTKYNFRVQLHRNLLNSADLLIAPSNFTRKKFIQWGINENKIRALYYGIPRRALRGVKKTVSPRIRFGFLGTFLKHKGLEVLLDAFNKIPIGDAELYIHGFGDENENEFLENLKKKAASNNNIFLMGEYAQEELPRILSNIDVLVVPSTWYETLNIVAREGILSGTPVIGSNIGGIPESVVDGKNGFLFEPGNSDELYKKMMVFLEDRNLIEEMSKAQTEIVGIEEHLEIIEGIYNGLVCSKRK